MSYWLYFQTGINLALAGACIYLYMQQRRSRAQGDWKQELGPLVETLGELLVEVDRLATTGTASQVITSSVEAPAQMVAEQAAPARTQVSEERPSREVVSKVNAVPSQVAPDKPSLVAPVLELAGQGLDVDQIAERLGRPIGEITLVLGLRSSFAASA